MKKSILNLFIPFLFVTLFFPSTGMAAHPPYIVIGYTPNNYNSNGSYTFRTEDIPWNALTHVYESFAVVNGTTLTFQRRIGMIEEAHKNGVRVYLSVGGSSSTAWPTGTTNIQTLANNIIALMNQGTDGDGTVCKYDGVDVDWEYPSNSTDFTNLLSDLRTGLNGLTYTVAPTFAAEQPHGTNTSGVGLTFFLPGAGNMCNYGVSTAKDSADWAFVGGYDFNIGAGATDLYQGPLTQAGFSGGCSSAINYDVSSLVNAYVGLGLPAAQMVLGCPLYARMNNGAGPQPIVKVITGTFNSRIASGDEASYTWSGGTYGTDDATSFCAKINWEKNKGMLGIGLWDVGQGLPTTANAGISQIWDMIADNNSCVTITGGCKVAGACTPTFSPTPTPQCGYLVDDLESGMFTNSLGGFWTASGPSPSSVCSPVYTMNPLVGTQFYPSYGYGLGGSDIGARFYGTNVAVTNASCYGSPALICSFGAGAAPNYNATAIGATGIQFNLKVSAAPSFPTTITALLYSDAAQLVSPVNWAEYYFNVVVPAANVDTVVKIPFASFSPPTTGTAYTEDYTKLWYIAWKAGYLGGSYDFTIDNVYFECAPATTPTFTSTPTKTNTPTATPTKTFTPTAASTNTYTATPTPTRTNTVTNTVTPTPTKTNTPTSTNTNTPANSSTFTNTPTSTPTKTNSPTPTSTNTNTPANSNTFTNTATSTPTKTNTSTATSTPTSTNTNTPANSFTFTNTPTSTPTKTNTNTASFTPTSTNTNTPANTNTTTSTATNTPTKTNTNSSTPTNTVTNTNTATSTNTPTRTNTGTPTNTPLFSYTVTNSPTNTLSPTSTSTPTNTSTRTNTSSPTNTNTLTSTPTNSNSFTNTPTKTFTNTSTPTMTHTNSPTSTDTSSPTITNTPTITGTPTNTPLFSFTFTNSPTNTNTPTKTFTNTNTNTFTSTPTLTPTSTNTPTITGTPTNTPLFSFTFTDTPTNTDTPTKTNTLTSTNTSTATPSPTNTSLFTATSTFTPTSTWTNTRSFTPTNTFTFTSTPTSTVTSTFTYTLTPTVTSTATQPVVNVTFANQPGSQTVGGGATNVVVLGLSATNASGEGEQLNSFSLSAGGTGSSSSGIVSLTIWKNPSGNGLIGSSTVVTTVSLPYAGGNNIVVNFSDLIPASSTQYYLVSYNFSGNPPAGTYTVGLTGMSGSGVISTKPLQVNGLPLNSTTFTVNANTFTPTSTATSTVTATKTATLTPTKVPTALPKGSPTPVIYPNPGDGGPVYIMIPGQKGTVSVKVELFTTAYRKVQTATFPTVPVGGPGAGPLNMTDEWGNRLASGLYYVVVTTTPNSNSGDVPLHMVGKMLLLR